MAMFTHFYVCICMQVKVTYQSGTRKVLINTPNRKRGIKKLTQGSYKSMAAMMLSAPGNSKSFIIEMGCNIIREMHILSSDDMTLFFIVLLKH